MVAGEGDFLGDGVQDAFGIAQHLVVPEADHAVPVGFDDSRAVRVRGTVGVLSAIEFYGDAKAPAGKIRDEVTNRKLPGELRSAQLARTQAHPQPLFRLGRFVTQLAREVGQSLFHHRGTPIPNPFPQGKGLLIAKLS